MLFVSASFKIHIFLVNLWCILLQNILPNFTLKCNHQKYFSLSFLWGSKTAASSHIKNCLSRLKWTLDPRGAKLCEKAAASLLSLHILVIYHNPLEIWRFWSPTSEVCWLTHSNFTVNHFVPRTKMNERGQTHNKIPWDAY